MEKQLKEIIRSVIREEFISELSKNDVHVKEIMKFYDKGTYSTKKAVSIFVSGKPNATRNQIIDDLGDMGYNDVWEVMDHFKLTLESVNEKLSKKDIEKLTSYKDLSKFIKLNKSKISSKDFVYIEDEVEALKYLESDYKRGKADRQEVEVAVIDAQDSIKKAMGTKIESVNKNTLNEGFADSIKKIRNLAVKMASKKFDRAKSHLDIDKIASSDGFDGKDVMNKATSALLQQSEMNEDIKSVINKIAVKLGTGSTMLGVITALVSMSGWVQYLNSTFTRWYYSEIQKLAEPEVMQIMKTAGQDGGSMYSKIGMYAFFIFFTIAVISLVAARMTQKPKNEADVVPGGLAKGLTLNDIAEKHGVSVDMMVAEFKKGIAVEMEHTTDREVAKEITLDHLFEDPKYYDKLKKVEEYVDKKGVEHVAAALPQTEEEPIKECKIC